MDNSQLKKKLSTYVTEGGQLRNVGEDVLYELLVSWEEWPSTGKEFYRSIGFTQKQIAKLLGKAKKMKREGVFGSSEFKEILVENVSSPEGSANSCGLIELACKDGKVIRFPQVSQLLEYVKKAG